MANMPKTMRSLVAPRECLPAEYEVRQVPTPKITLPTHVLIKMRAVSMETGLLRMAAGEMKMFYAPEYPLPIGSEGSGVVVAVGSGVKSLKVGDAVYGLYMDKPIFRTPPPGFASEYALAEEAFLLVKPAHLSFEEASTMAGRVVTALQVIRRGLQLRGEKNLKGKTMFVTGGLGATGSIAIEMAKRVFGAERIITTVATRNVSRVEEHLPGLVDQVIDYQTQDPVKVLGKGTVDFFYSTQAGTQALGIALAKRNTGTLMSIVDMPSKETVRELVGPETIGWFFGGLLDLAQLWNQWKMRGTGIAYGMVSGGVQIREDLEEAGEIIAQGKVKGLYSVLDLEDIEGVRRECEAIVNRKGGFGKLVIRISGE